MPDEETFVEVSVITTSGSFPISGYEKSPSQQKVKVDLGRAADELKITNTQNWIARVNGREINPELSFLENKLTGRLSIDWGPRQGGGGLIK